MEKNANSCIRMLDMLIAEKKLCQHLFSFFIFYIWMFITFKLKVPKRLEALIIDTQCFPEKILNKIYKEIGHSTPFKDDAFHEPRIWRKVQHKVPWGTT